MNKRSYILLPVVAIGLSLFGLLMIFEVSSGSAMRDFNNKYYFLKSQAIWFVVGIAAMLVASHINFRRYYQISIFALFGMIILLIAVFLPGIGIKVSGAHRWINLGFFKLQPAELAKLILVIYLAAWFTYKEKERLLPFLLLLGLILALIVLEPDLGTAVIIGAIAIVLYFLSGAHVWHFGFLLPMGLAGAVVLSIVSPYRYRRLMTFFNKDADPLGASYHIRQLLFALGNGGLLGIGIGQSRQKFSYLPEAATDSIFAIVGEEFGFIGASVVLFLYLFIILKSFKIAINAPTRFGYLLGGGIASWFAIQIIINLGAIVSLLPLTGVPLPFLSYGGSSLVVSFYSVGILINISRQS